MPQNLRQMSSSFRRASDIAERSGADLYYPKWNWLTAEVALNAGKPRWRALDRETSQTLRQPAGEEAADADFWSVVGETEPNVYEALAAKRLGTVHEQLVRDYQDVDKRVTATRMWASVYDTACLVLPNYASRVKASERAAANELLSLLRRYARPESET